MRKFIKDLKVGEKIRILEQIFLIESIEFSNIGKQGKRKCRIELKSKTGEKSIIVRPEDFEIETLK